MESLYWIPLGLGVLVLVGLFFFVRTRRDAGLPFDHLPSHDPLEGNQGAEPERREPLIEDITGWIEEGTGPVRRRPLADDEIPPPLPAQRRKPRFDFDKPAAQADLPLAEGVCNEHAQAAPDAVTLYLIARDPQGFAGARLIELFGQYGFEFGEMDVYHRTDVETQSKIGLVNGVAPGTFDPSILPKQSTPALAMFLRLPIRGTPCLAFDQFLDIAYRMAEELNADLLDEQRELLSSESIDRMRQLALGE